MRNPENGKWFLNCHQIKYKNYSIHFNSGYDVSTREDCLYCDMALGPFLAKTEALKAVKMESKFSGSHVISPDFFLKVHLMSGQCLAVGHTATDKL